MFLVANFSLLGGALILMEIDTDHGFGKVSMIMTHVIQYTYIVIMMAGICAVLVMNVVDDVTRRSDLKMGNRLREFSHLELVKRDFQLEVVNLS